MDEDLDGTGPLNAEQLANWRRVLTAQLGIVPSDDYIEKYRTALQRQVDLHEDKRSRKFR